MSRRMIGRYIVADDRICNGRPTFRGTDILVADVLARLAKGMPWETIIEEQRDRIPKEAIREALTLAGQAFMEHLDNYVIDTIAS